VLTGKVARVSAHVGELEETVDGRSSAADLETLLTLVNLAFGTPRRSPHAFEAWREHAFEMVKHRSLSPEQTFEDAWRAFRTQDHPRRRPATADALRRVDLDRALAIYRDRFSVAGDFTFVIVGDVELGRTRRLVETYLASLPATGRNESFRDLGIQFRPGTPRMTLAKGTDPKGRVEITFHGQSPFSRAAEDDLRTLTGVFGRRLREALRDERGEVYAVSVASAFMRRPLQEYMLVVQFGCAPDRVGELVHAVFDEASALKQSVALDLVTKERAIRRRSFDKNVNDNAFWLRELAQAYRHGDPPEAILDIEAALSRIEPSIVRDSARKYLDDHEYITGVFVPETLR
jgi:zinc protease